MCKCVCVCVFKLPNCRLQPVKMNVVFNPLAGYRVRSVTQCLRGGLKASTQEERGDPSTVK